VPRRCGFGKVAVGWERDGEGGERGDDDNNGDRFALLHGYYSLVTVSVFILDALKRLLKRNEIPVFFQGWYKEDSKLF
jgi:hypothetical protein